MTAVDPFMVREAACRASVLVATGRFRPDDWEDLQQELILDLLRRSRRFLASLASAGSSFGSCGVPHMQHFHGRCFSSR